MKLLILLQIYLQCISIGECFPTHFAMNRLYRRVELLNMEPEVSFSTACCGTQLALEYWFITGVNQAMRFQ